MTREPEWDDEQRDRMLALADYEAGICSGCGWHHDLIHEPGAGFKIDLDTCPVCAQVAQYGRWQEELDKENDRRIGETDAREPRPTDGRKVRLQHLTPQQAELERARRAARRRGD